MNQKSGNRQRASGTLNPDTAGATTYTANALNPVHDADGNMTSGPLPVDPAANATLVWDAENRLVAVTRADNTVVYFAYDAQGRRISKQTGNGAMSAYVYDGWNMASEYSIANGTITLVMSFTWGLDLSGTLQGAGGVGGLLAVRRHTGPGVGTYYPAYDGNGNITEYLNSSDYGLRLTYDAFGNTIAKAGTFSSQPTASLPFRFSTKYLDEETGLYYYGYRYYDPVTGRWLSRDPIVEKGGLNLYGFVDNDGVNNWDLFGLTRVKRPSGTPIKSITVKRKKVKWLLIFKEKLGKPVDPNIDTYGHWWIVFGGESYGWWPKFGVSGIRETVQDVPGELNGVANFGGTATTAPHHSHAAETEFTPKLRGGFLSSGKLEYGSASGIDCNCATDGEIQECFRKFAKQYSGNWSYPLGQNCHSFQKEGMRSCCLKK